MAPRPLPSNISLQRNVLLRINFLPRNVCLFPVQDQALDEEFHHPVSVESSMTQIGPHLELEVLTRCLKGGNELERVGRMDVVVRCTKEKHEIAF